MREQRSKKTVTRSEGQEEKRPKKRQEERCEGEEGVFSFLQMALVFPGNHSGERQERKPREIYERGEDPDNTNT